MAILKIFQCCVVHVLILVFHNLESRKNGNAYNILRANIAFNTFCKLYKNNRGLFLPYFIYLLSCTSLSTNCIDYIKRTMAYSGLT